MAHRQSGGYKEEPGVAVTGDHVSTQRLLAGVVTFLIPRIIHAFWSFLCNVELSSSCQLRAATVHHVCNLLCFHQPFVCTSQAAPLWFGCIVRRTEQREVWLRYLLEDHEQLSRAATRMQVSSTAIEGSSRPGRLEDKRFRGHVSH